MGTSFPFPFPLSFPPVPDSARVAAAGFEGDGEGDEADLRDGTDEAVEVARWDMPLD
jgi:hypothetical protein